MKRPSGSIKGPVNPFMASNTEAAQQKKAKPRLFIGINSCTRKDATEPRVQVAMQKGVFDFLAVQLISCVVATVMGRTCTDDGKIFASCERSGSPRCAGGAALCSWRVHSRPRAWHRMLCCSDSPILILMCRNDCRSLCDRRVSDRQKATYATKAFGAAVEAISWCLVRAEPSCLTVHGWTPWCRELSFFRAWPTSST